MKVSGNSGDLTPKKYTIEDLGIKEGSHEASIFKEIDKEDGKEHGFLTAAQLEAYNRELNGYDRYDLDKNKETSLFEMSDYHKQVEDELHEVEDELHELESPFTKLRRAIAPENKTRKKQ